MSRHGDADSPRLPPLRVLHVVPSFYPAHGYGGPVSALYELCLAQVAAGLDVRVLTSAASGPGASSRLTELSGRWVTQFGVKTLYAPVRFGEDLAPSLLWHVANQLRSTDLLHVSGLWSPTSLLGIGLGRLLGKPTIVSPHGALMPWALDSGRGRTRKLQVLHALRPLLRRLAGWHVSSAAEAQGLAELVAHGHLPSQVPICQVEHGVRPSALSVTDPSPSSPPEKTGPARILVLGRVHPVKNLELALSSLAALRKDRPEVTLQIAGPATDRDYLAKLQALADSLGLKDAVQWLGLVGPDEKARLLSQATVLWLCSHMESFGVVVVEALASGTPVVAVTATPWAELPQQAVGHHVAPSPDAIAAATLRLLEQSPTDREQQSLRCRRFVAERYTWPVLEARLRAFYRLALVSDSRTSTS